MSLTITCTNYTPAETLELRFQSAEPFYAVIADFDDPSRTRIEFGRDTEGTTTVRFFIADTTVAEARSTHVDNGARGRANHTLADRCAEYRSAGVPRRDPVYL